jgi:hypothetical protein
MRHRFIPALAAAVTLGTSLPAFAQPTPAAQPGTMIIERIEQGFVFAPDVRITEVNDHTSTLVGGYAGWMTDRTWLVGGGGYWLVNGSDDLEMAYGGLVAEWLARSDERIGFGIRGLVGGGGATIGTTAGEYFGVRDLDVPRGDPRFRHANQWMRGGHGGAAIDAETALLVHEYFFVAEPQANVILHFSRWARLNVGVGYRLTAGAGPLDDELSGASGSIAIQFGGASRKKP